MKSDVHSEARVQNIVDNVGTRAGAQDEYYSWKAMSEKLGEAAQTGMISAEEKKSILSLSDLELLELRVLAKLNRLSDSSPELLAYYSLCNTQDRFATAKVVSRKAYRKAVVSNSLNALVDSTALLGTVKANDAQSRTNRASVNAFGLANSDTTRAFGNIA
jgi:hypothetical protein